MQSDAIKSAVIETLRRVVDPGSRRDVITLGWIRNVAVCDGLAEISYDIPASAATDALQDQLRRQTQVAVSATPGLKSVNVDFHIFADRVTNSLPGVKHVIAVGAGKGGVGKSTVSAVLAAGLTRMGLTAGLLDADVYGPSLPKITGTEQAQPMLDEQGRIIPPVRDGIRIMSMGYLVAPDQAIVWRGPMAQKYVKEFLDRGLWGELDYLIVDLPPGTGDIPLTLAQSIPLTGAVVVCTPQDVALLDAMKALRMYQKLGVEPLGVVENMSYYICPHCGRREEIFSHGGAEKAASEMNVPFLGAIPLNIGIRQNGDAGELFANFARVEPHVIAALEHVVKRLVDEVDRHVKQRKPLPQLRVTG
ncbi:MAG: Mrp/NBP35 family ATP-binding protein [Phycisphaerae bacterium]